MEGYDGIFTSALPHDPGWYAADPHNEWCNNMCGPPLLRHSSGDRKWNKYESKDVDQQYDTDNIQLPEELNSKTSSAKHLIGGLVLVKDPVLLRPPPNNSKSNDQR